MEIKYVLNKEDYIAFNLNHIINSETMRRSIFIQRYIISIIFLIVPFVLKNNSTIPFSYWMTLFTITYILWIVFYPKHIYKSIKRNTEKM